MKIVYNILGTFNSGGMERVLANKANYWIDKGHEVFVITTDQQGRKPYFNMHPEVTHIDLEINYTQDHDKGVLRKILSYTLKQRKHRQLLELLLKDLKADIVISMFDHDASFLYKIKEGSKKVLEIHFSRYKRLQYARKGIWRVLDHLRNRMDGRVAKKYDCFVVLTHEDKNYWGNGGHTRVIPNANSFKPSGKAALDAKKAIAVGRYDEQKGFDELIKIWKKVYEVHPDWTLDIFGKGPLKETLQSLIDDLELSEVVHLCSPVKDIEQCYINSSFLVMTSRYEGLPMTLLEAQVCGLPLLAYACKCGPRDIIQDGQNGFLLEEGDRVGMVEKINLLIENKDLRQILGAQSLKRSVHFSEEKVMQQWLQLFTALKEDKEYNKK
ncbi:glycosyltransferase [Elizabethkingia argentiflava]|uniref:Glycosyltransferase n=1 Tax=Elizabethkingia argenteiflava TaxID=2681556 RepID=A0A845PWJ6_9FLAO|nr:glycosyltransferase family 4 protein [Elizabethkingia argenteiflava]NAW51341.1 glycosyltransferase [Elizabethkingia argenteiflava]